MTLPAFAAVSDLEERLGLTFDDADDYGRAQAALNDASSLIRLEAGMSWVTDGALDFGDLDEFKQDVILSITVAVARRVLENPEGAVEMSFGDASMKLSNDSSDVFLKASEKAMIASIAGTSGRFGSIDLEIGTPGWSGDVIAVYGQDEPMPFTYEPLRP